MHIALCAAAFTASSYLIAGEPVDYIYTSFITASTWLLYSLHRIIGINKVDASLSDDRFTLIRKYRTHLKIYAGIAALGSIILYFFLPNRTKILLILPSLLSILYVIPIFTKSMRLRDFDYIKIFLVAICWALLCAYIPLANLGLTQKELLLITIEKSLFIFAITLPFDFRDIRVDRISNVKTLAHVLRKHIDMAITAVFLLAMLFMFVNPIYGLSSKIYFGILYALLLAICLRFYKKEDDLYISGIIDATMLLYGIFTFGFYLYIAN